VPPVLYGEAEAGGLGRPRGAFPAAVRQEELNRPDLESWLERYGRAWERKDPNAAITLFTEDATYRETPFDEVMSGREAIRAYWQQIPDTQDDISFGSEVLHAGGDRAFVHWWARYVRIRDGQRVRLDGAFVLEFENGLCRSLREWWHADPGPAF
jgi:uncharacterized protein (TIGR02246 family)